MVTLVEHLQQLIRFTNKLLKLKSIIAITTKQIEGCNHEGEQATENRFERKLDSVRQWRI